MYTRKQYLDKECTHREYYSQFVTNESINSVLRIIGKNRLLTSKNESFNDIPLELWDMINTPCQKRMEKCGDYKTKAGIVCIAKESARQILENEGVNNV